MSAMSNLHLEQREAEERERAAGGWPAGEPEQTAADVETPAPLALGTDRRAPVITVDRWPFRANYRATFQDVCDRRAQLQAEYGACEWVCVEQDSAHPEIHFRIPNPATRDLATLDDLRESLDAVAAQDWADVEAA